MFRRNLSECGDLDQCYVLWCVCDRHVRVFASLVYLGDLHDHTHSWEFLETSEQCQVSRIHAREMLVAFRSLTTTCHNYHEQHTRRCTYRVEVARVRLQWVCASERLYIHFSNDSGWRIPSVVRRTNVPNACSLHASYPLYDRCMKTPVINNNHRHSRACVKYSPIKNLVSVFPSMEKYVIWSISHNILRHIVCTCVNIVYVVHICI
jgi:hypothetical protein